MSSNFLDPPSPPPPTLSPPHQDYCLSQEMNCKDAHAAIHHTARAQVKKQKGGARKQKKAWYVLILVIEQRRPLK